MRGVWCLVLGTGCWGWRFRGWLDGFDAALGRAVSTKPPPPPPMAWRPNTKGHESPLRGTRKCGGVFDHRRYGTVFVSAEGGFRAFSCSAPQGTQRFSAFQCPPKVASVYFSGKAPWRAWSGGEFATEGTEAAVGRHGTHGRTGARCRVLGAWFRVRWFWYRAWSDGSGAGLGRAVSMKPSGGSDEMRGSPLHPASGNTRKERQAPKIVSN